VEWSRGVGEEARRGERFKAFGSAGKDQRVPTPALSPLFFVLFFSSRAKHYIDSLANRTKTVYVFFKKNKSCLCLLGKYHYYIMIWHKIRKLTLKGPRAALSKFYS